MSSGARILLVDDSPATLEVVGRILSGQGHAIDTAPDVPSAVSRLSGLPVDLVITDFRMPGPDGLDLIRHVRENLPGTAVVMLTGYPSIEGAVEAVKGGAEAYLTKPFTQAELLAAVEEALVASGQRSPSATDGLHLPLIGRSDTARRLRETIEQLAGKPDPMLVDAAAGSGGIAFARALHDAGERRHRAFEVVYCNLLREGGAEEIFGRKDGDQGLVEQANGGTLVLVEPATLGGTAQVHLLRLLQERRCFRIDGGKPRPVSLRIIAVARRDLAALAGVGAFRRDLLERLGANRIRLPALHTRREDIVDIVLAAMNSEANLIRAQQPTISEQALASLTEADWPGGFPELTSAVQGIVARTANRGIEASDLPPRFRFSAVENEDEALPTLAELEKAHIRLVLDRVGGNKTEAAKMLGIDRKTLRSKI